MPSRAADVVDQTTRRDIRRGPIEGGPPTGPPRRYSEGAREETSLLGFINVVLGYRGILVISALTGAFIFGLTSVNDTRMYAASASVTLTRVRPRAAISELATQLGLMTASAGDQGQSGPFYLDLIKSRAILEPVASLPYAISTSRGRSQRSLASWYGVDDKSPAVAASQSIDELRSRISVSGDNRTGIIGVTVRAPFPQLAQQILQNILQEVDAYNARQRRAQATAERDFVEKMLNDARGVLNEAESRLGTFRELNREYTSSPTLSLENDRLTRAVRMRQQIYTAMAQSYEQAKIEEVRDLPALAVLDPPEAAIAPDRRTVFRQTLLGLVAGLMVGIVLAFVHIRAREIRNAGTPAYREYSVLKKETLASLAHVWRAMSLRGG